MNLFSRQSSGVGQLEDGLTSIARTLETLGGDGPNAAAMDMINKLQKDIADVMTHEENNRSAASPGYN